VSSHRTTCSSKMIVYEQSWCGDWFEVETFTASSDEIKMPENHQPPKSSSSDVREGPDRKLQSILGGEATNTDGRSKQSEEGEKPCSSLIVSIEEADMVFSKANQKTVIRALLSSALNEQNRGHRRQMAIIQGIAFQTFPTCSEVECGKNRNSDTSKDWGVTSNINL
jgi:hypothetical protein